MVMIKSFKIRKFQNINFLENVEGSCKKKTGKYNVFNHRLEDDYD